MTRPNYDETEEMKMADGKEIDGYGASFRRDLNAWVIYTMPDAVEFAQIKGFDAPVLDIVLALRATLPTHQNSNRGETECL